MEKTAKTKWIIDPAHSEVTFKVKHMMISTVTGYFGEFDATIEASDGNFENAEVSFSGKINSISTRNDYRDNHLKSDDFFNAEKFPDMTFQSTSFEDGTLTGNLTIREVTKEISLRTDFNGVVVDSSGPARAGFEAAGSINRKDFNLNWNAVTETGNVVVSDKVNLIINAQFTKQA